MRQTFEFPKNNKDIIQKRLSHCDQHDISGTKIIIIKRDVNRIHQS